MKLNMKTENLANENYKKLAQLFPNAITETIDENGQVVRAIDKDVLMQEINTHVVEGKEERYQFTWPDKKKAILEAARNTNKTLRPNINESVNFINTKNIYIEGDNLEVLRILRETYLHSIDLIYIDPPYNTGKNIIYKNDFHQSNYDYLRASKQINDQGLILETNKESNGRFHTDWLNMIYPRIKIAKLLLKEDGVFAIAIDENELDTLSLVLKEIFNENSYEHSLITMVHNPRGQQGVNFSYVNEFLILIYKKDGVKYLTDVDKEDVDSRNLRDSGTDSDRTNAKNCFYPFLCLDGKIIGIGDVPSANFHPEKNNIYKEDGIIEIWPLDDNGNEKKWRYARNTVENIIDDLEVKQGRNSFQIIYNKSKGTVRSVWSQPKYDSSEYGSKLVQELFGSALFTYPKSLWSVYDILDITTSYRENALILDFFAGSSTTAHACMELNINKKLNHKYIMVQVDENLKDTISSVNGKERQSVINTIEYMKNINKPPLLSEIGKERIRRAGKKILEENKDKEGIENLDIGFRVLKCDTSNMKDVYYSPQDIQQTMLDDMSDNIKEDRTSEDLLFQVMLDLGVELSAKIEEKEVQGKKVFYIDDNYLVATFDKDINDKIISEIAKQKPYYFVMRDSSLSGDSVSSNFDQIFNTYSPETIRKVL